ncbi:alkaline phosphatase D family protein [Fuerstiella marisgermanici]|uniref:Alkaline phosphatase D n=1 Tax=Fuerstiella marisgermanici TaxID=1891926 RepID=A0A1P8WKZ8_9PLAN|nr:alkaline phosphatase D family protein [Fuerstiella marisgermanici]APZ94742.1 Alkaline phosphatase D precursor [Fuerstiella marisgermanici]
MKFLTSFIALAMAVSPAAADKPNVLIIGDSISLGYTPHVVKLMEDEANVVHNKGNAQHTGTGLQKLDRWLGDTKWDVVHFNWGLWDLCYRHPESKNQGRRDKVRGTLTTTLEKYEQNLDELVTKLKSTGATLVWASTTVVPEGEAGRKRNDDLKYNDVAARVMQKHGVRINDLNKLSRTFEANLFTQPGDVHFKPVGYQKLADQVAGAIREALASRDAEQPLSRILFGSCIKQDRPMPILRTIVDSQPDLFVFLGDNIYGDTEDMDVLRAKYAKLAADAGFNQLQKTCPTLATWDDHDYGVNDGGADYSKREESEQVFEDFWQRSADSASRKRPGVYDTQMFGPNGQRVQVILLDTRYFRSPLKRGEKRVGGSWIPDDDPTKTMLGEAQWKWLGEQLRQPAELRIIASGIQFLAEDAGQETWSNLPRERQRMLDLLTSTEANGVIFISGDRHWSELSAINEGAPYRLYDFTSSSLNQLHPRGTPTKNSFRALPTTYHKENFGVIAVDWDQKDPQITLSIRDLDDNLRLQHEVRLSELNR